MGSILFNYPHRFFAIIGGGYAGVYLFELAVGGAAGSTTGKWSADFAYEWATE
ncbi:MULTISPECIES: hypothetical protein [Vibrio]|uniref:hypothetical protein n=1 Tax=Vibrio TaxID=662 RepID=UPI0020750622|nr:MULTISPECIES: hypothetical protein [Vibrio]USD34966.1 hypothetical protein J8Z27_16770 [Vibrio sp. SCSIO 43186]USD48031.1 hypothetical protein J4N38_17160 [Vibrio sp. SCSIO 43145]USD72090.1 hypothetical protein J4N41_16780 [Vibrio sp. SCSIO 43139]